MWFNTFSTRPLPADAPAGDDALAGKGAGYVFNPDLEAAIDVAIGLGRPLLVSGEPGCGKTELGYAVARRLGIDRVQFHSTKSTSEARDLFYTYDAVGRFREAQIAQIQGGALADIGDYIEFQALGRAILDAHERADVEHLLRGRNAYRHPGTPQRSVVIIDEIDKAPRDFPNDLLAEIEDLSFRVGEFARAAAGSDATRPPQTPPGSRIARAVRPIIIITSNEERQLPDAFLRRCVFHEIAFPSDTLLAAIVESGLRRRFPRNAAGGDFTLPPPEQAALIKLLRDFRALALDKKPGVSELIDAATLMAFPQGSTPPPLADRLRSTGAALAKLKQDRDAFAGLTAATTPTG